MKKVKESSRGKTSGEWRRLLFSPSLPRVADSEVHLAKKSWGRYVLSFALTNYPEQWLKTR